MLDTTNDSAVVEPVSETSSSVSSAGETEETSAAKRHRTSPIAKVYALVDGLMDSVIAGLLKQNEDNVDPELDVSSLIVFAEGLRTDIAALRVAPVAASPQAEGAKRRGRPKGSKNKPKEPGMETSASSSKSAGAWYVGVGADGSRSALKAGAVPTTTTHTEFATVYGPFATKRAAVVRSEKTDADLAAAQWSMPRVF